jgi:release factor glutamine methyltransferase
MGPRKVRVMGRTYTLYKNVHNPRLLGASEFIARNIHVKPEDRVLDMGTGCGILAITAAQTNERVVAVDINSVAVQCAQENAQRNGFNYITFIHSDLFSELDSDTKYDVILVHPPFTEGKPENIPSHEKYIPGNSFAARFFKEAKNHLEENGYILTIYPTYAGHERFRELARENGWTLDIVAQKRTFYTTFIIYRGYIK